MLKFAGPSRPLARLAHAMRPAVDDDDDLGDVLSEESERLLQTSGLPPYKRAHAPQEGVLQPAAT